MKTVDWGQGWEISSLCFGALPMGPLQKNMSPEEGGQVIRAALEMGVNFIDTAQVYKTYDHIRLGLQGWQGKVYIASKSNATCYEEMAQAVEEAREKLNRDHIDIFHLHCARVEPTVFQEREGALTCLKDLKEKGIIGRIGIATHSVPVVRRAAMQDDIDVIFPLINTLGLGILQGNTKDMEKAIEEAARQGKRLYAMKVFAGGNLLGDRQGALDYVLGIPGLDVVSLGMVHRDEVEVNVGLLGQGVSPLLLEKTKKEGKKLIILGFCNGCGTCLEHCPNAALYLEEEKCQVEREKCILCGYCAPHCPQFAIRMV